MIRVSGKNRRPTFGGSFFADFSGFIHCPPRWIVEARVLRYMRKCRSEAVFFVKPIARGSIARPSDERLFALCTSMDR